MPQRIRAGCDHLPTNSRLPPCRFATAHSRGLRLGKCRRRFCSLRLCHSAFARVATITIKRLLEMAILCHSAFARVATGNKCCATCGHYLCHSAFARVATPSVLSSFLKCASLPQRIRAGCDFDNPQKEVDIVLCHSAFARVATQAVLGRSCPCRLCHSAFVRVATSRRTRHLSRSLTFATAHSCGLRPNALIQCIEDANFATAHSRGLRRASNNKLRLYAFFATAHSRGLRHITTLLSACMGFFATAHSRGLRLLSAVAD